MTLAGTSTSLTSRKNGMTTHTHTHTQIGNRGVGAIVISTIDAASQEAVMGSAQRVVVARARAPRDAVVQRCLEYLGSEYSDFELEGSAWSVVQFESVLPEAAP